jgi:hypothetical protein
MERNQFTVNPYCVIAINGISYFLKGTKPGDVLENIGSEQFRNIQSGAIFQGENIGHCSGTQLVFDEAEGTI